MKNTAKVISATSSLKGCPPTNLLLDSHNNEDI